MKKINLMLAAVIFGSIICFAESDVNQKTGVVKSAEFYSKTIGDNIKYNVYLPWDYSDKNKSFPVIYLLHGRGDNMNGWLKIKEDLDKMIEENKLSSMIAVMPNAPWEEASGYYVDSQYKTGKNIETAFTKDLIENIDSNYRTVSDREHRYISGYSMGGYGAVRYILAHPELFSAAVILSSAIYYPLPPKDSSTREYGAFGKDDQLFVDNIWLEKNYPEAVKIFEQSGLKINLFIAVGDKEWKIPDFADRMHDLDMEAHMLFNYLCRIKNISVNFRVLGGGHDWDVWKPAFVQGLPMVLEKENK